MQVNKLKRHLRTVLAFRGNAIHRPLRKVVKVLAGAQDAAAKNGPVCEIGVHDGRFMIGLMQIADPTGKSLGIDVFDLPRFNKGRISTKRQDTFLRNVGRCYGDRKVGIIETDSFNLSSPDIFAIHAEYGKFAMFSLSNCRTAGHTYHNLRTAAELTAHGGIIFIDNYYHPCFPGVQEGVCQYFLKDEPKLAPLAFAGRKLILTDVSHHKTYYTQLRKNFRTGPGSGVEHCERFGWATLSFVPDRRANPVMRAARIVPKIWASFMSKAFSPSHSEPAGGREPVDGKPAGANSTDVPAKLD